jgi:hypothetical protein
MKASAIVFDALTVKHGAPFTFDVWYVNHYLSSMLATDSYLGVRRYGSPARATYLAIFETDAASNPPLPSTADHDAIVSVERYTARQIGEQISGHASDHVVDAPFVYPVFFRVPPEREAEFDSWYDTEHLPILLRCAHWPMCRRFKVSDPGPESPTHIALHYLTSLQALESDERTQARTTPWRDRLAREPWFKGEYRVYHRHGAGLQSG